MPVFLRKTLACFFLVAIAVGAAPPAPLPAKPKLILAIAIDQFRYDYLTRYRSEYTGGLNRLLPRARSSPTPITSTTRPSPRSATARS